MGDRVGSDDVVRGVVDRVESGVARVFVGDDEVEWFFPTQMLPSDADAGACIWLSLADGRFSVLGCTPERTSPDIRGFAERLERMRSSRRGLADLQPLS